MSGGGITFDTLFGEPFFKRPVKVRKTKLSFPLPDDRNKLDEFINEHGREYRAGVMELVSKLQVLAEQQGLWNDRAKTSVEIYLNKFNYNQTASDDYKESIFSLYTVGVSYLAEIIDFYQKEKNWSESSKTNLKNLLYGMNVCAGMVYTHICDARMILFSDLRGELQSIRREIAKAAAEEFLEKNLDMPIGTPGHFDNALVNLYARKLAIPKIEDFLSENMTPAPILQKKFFRQLAQQFNASNIIDHIMMRHQHLLSKLKPHEKLDEVLAVKLAEWLEKYGVDETAFDQIATYDEKSDAYHIKPHVEYYIIHALFVRLANSHVFNYMEPKVESVSGVSIFIPSKNNVRLAYVKYADKHPSDEPFVLYCLEQIYNDAKQGTNSISQLEQLCDDEQRSELRAELIRLIEMDWVEQITNRSVEEQKAMFKFFNQEFPAAYIQLMRMLLDSHLLPAEMHSMLVELSFIDKVIKGNNIHELVTFLSFYPKEQWLDVLTNDLQGMDLLDHRPVVAIVEMLSPLNITESQLREILANDSLSNAIVTLINADMIIDVNIVRFLLAHAVNAESLAMVMFVFNLYVEARIDQEFLAFLAAYTKQAKDFLACIDRTTNADEWLTHFYQKGIIDLKRMKRLMNHAAYINEIIAVLADLWLYDESDCHDWVDFILDKTKNISQVVLLREIISHCNDMKVKLKKINLEAIFSHQDVYYPAVINDTLLAFYAAMLGMTELLESMIRANVISISDVLPVGSGIAFSGATLLAVAILHNCSDICKMLLANGASADVAMTVKISQLEQTFSESRQITWTEFLQEKTGFTQSNPDSEVTVTARELAVLVGNKEVQACFEIPKEEPSLSAHVAHSIFGSSTSSVTEGDEPATHPHPPEFDA